MVIAKRMGMSEEEFWNSCPFFFNKLSEKFFELERREKEIYGR